MRQRSDKGRLESESPVPGVASGMLACPKQAGEVRAHDQLVIERLQGTCWGGQGTREAWGLGMKLGASVPRQQGHLVQDTDVHSSLQGELQAVSCGACRGPPTTPGPEAKRQGGLRGEGLEGWREESGGAKSALAIRRLSGKAL